MYSGQKGMGTITIRYFASIRERMGKSQEVIEVKNDLSVVDVWVQVCNAPLPANTLIAVNQEYVSTNQSVRDGDEVAFFPPVTGG
jgi:molybdopterin synthase sulfur carrier subunit